MKNDKQLKETLDILGRLVRENCGYGHHYTPDGNTPTYHKVIQLLCKHDIMVCRPRKDKDGYTYKEYYFAGEEKEFE